MNRFRVDIVVAHYNENLHWLRTLQDPRIDQVYVYTKSRLRFGFKKTVIKDSLRLSRSLLQMWSGSLTKQLSHEFLPNIGREAHTYCHHCFAHYERYNREGKNRLVLLLQGQPHVGAEPVGGAEIVKWINDVEASGKSHTLNFTRGSAHEYLEGGKQVYWKGDVDDSPQSIDEWSLQYIGREVNLESCPIYWSACFGVLADKVTSRDRSEYHALCVGPLGSRNPEAAYFLERLWYYWFNLDKS